MINDKGDMQQDELILPSIHPSYARLLAAFARSKVADISALFSGCSLDWETLQKSPSFVSFEQFRRLFLNVQRHSGIESLELELSHMAQAASHGPLGYGALAAPTLKDTFVLVKTMLATRITIIEMHLREHATTTSISVTSKINLQQLERFMYLMLLGSFVDFIQRGSGASLSGITVKFPFAEQASDQAFLNWFENPSVTYNAEHFELSVPSELLAQSNLTFDDFAYRNAYRECEQLLEQAGRGGAFARRVKTYLLERRGNLPSEDETAEHFGVSVRTLIRKLKQEGISYQGLLDEVRKELVVLWLNDASLSIEEVAARVGFVDTSNFARVFRRWFGQTPSQFRKAL